LYVLRIRRDGDAVIQTLKTRGKVLLSACPSAMNTIESAFQR
jgi:hypothetical protein